MGMLLRLASVVLIAFLVASSLSACAVLGSPDLYGLNFVSIDTANVSNRPDIAFESTAHGPDRPLLVVNFTAERDLNEYAKRYEYNIGDRASFCLGKEIDEARPLQSNPYVYDAEGMVDAFRKESSAKSSASPVTYSIYIAVRAVPLAGQDVFHYDLARDPRDVCIQLRGGNMLGNRFVSNVIVIPKAALANALRPH